MLPVLGNRTRQQLSVNIPVQQLSLMMSLLAHILIYRQNFGWRSQSAVSVVSRKFFSGIFFHWNRRSLGRRWKRIGHTLRNPDDGSLSFTVAAFIPLMLLIEKLLKEAHQLVGWTRQHAATATHLNSTQRLRRLQSRAFSAFLGNAICKQTSKKLDTAGDNWRD